MHITTATDMLIDITVMMTVATAAAGSVGAAAAAGGHFAVVSVDAAAAVSVVAAGGSCVPAAPGGCIAAAGAAVLAADIVVIGKVKCACMKGLGLTSSMSCRLKLASVIPSTNSEARKQQIEWLDQPLLQPKSSLTT